MWPYRPDAVCRCRGDRYPRATAYRRQQPVAGDLMANIGDTIAGDGGVFADHQAAQGDAAVFEIHGFDGAGAEHQAFDVFHGE